LIKNSVFQNIKQKHNTGKTIGCFTKTIGFLYQLLIDKTEFKEIVMEEVQAQAHMQAHQRVDLGQP